MANLDLTDSSLPVLDHAPAASILTDVDLNARYERCFGSVGVVPEWLFEPAELLELAYASNGSPALQLNALLRMAVQIDHIFAAKLPNLLLKPAYRNGHGAAMAGALPNWIGLLCQQATNLLHGQLLPALARDGLTVIPVTHVSEWQRTWLHRYFKQRIYPVLTPLAVDSGHPFPYISSDSLNLLVELTKPDVVTFDATPLLARVKIPGSTPRLVHMPDEPSDGAGLPDTVMQGIGDSQHCVWSGDLVRYFVYDLFAGMPVKCVYLFRVLRAEMPLANGHDGMAGRSRRHANRPVVRLDVEQSISDEVLAWLVGHLDVPAYGIVRHANPLEFMCLPHLVGFLKAAANRHELTNQAEPADENWLFGRQFGTD